MKRASSAFGFSAIDLLASLAVVFIVLSLALDPTPAKPTPQAGNLAVQLTWDMARDDDVDLWVKSPDDQPVGYLRKSGLHFDLVRDDLGKTSDPDSRNIEMAFARGVPAGTYIITAVLYHNHDGVLPVHVQLDVRYNTSDILNVDGELTAPGQELTLARFTLSAHGDVSNVNQLPAKLFDGTIP